MWTSVFKIRNVVHVLHLMKKKEFSTRCRKMQAKSLVFLLHPFRKLGTILKNWHEKSICLFFSLILINFSRQNVSVENSWNMFWGSEGSGHCYFTFIVRCENFFPHDVEKTLKLWLEKFLVKICRQEYISLKLKKIL